MREDKSLSRRILFVAAESGGGAGIAALRLFEELKRSGAEVRFLVWHDPIGPAVGWNHTADLTPPPGLRRKLYKALGMVRDAAVTFGRWRRNGKRDRFFHGQSDSFEITTLFPGRVHLENHPWFAWADIVHVHWVAGFLAPNQRWLEKVWVISLHDAYPLTAVCHFPADCARFETGCEECPQLAGTFNPRLSGRVFEQKKVAIDPQGRITLHAPSRWIAELASRSPLTKPFPSVVLPNLIPSSTFRPLNLAACREWLGLPADKKLALFVAGSVGNVRKGFVWFLKLAEALLGSDWVFVVVGGGDLPQLPANCRPLGRLGDPRLMSAAYNSADLFVSTAVQDNAPSTIMESQLCGTPVIGFSVGGQTEMIDQGVSGYLSSQVGLEGLLAGVEWFLKTAPSRASVAAIASQRWNQSRLLADWNRFYQELE